MAVGEEVGVDRSLGSVDLKEGLVPVLEVVVEVEGEWDDVLALLQFHTMIRMSPLMTRKNSRVQVTVCTRLVQELAVPPAVLLAYVVDKGA